MRPAITAAGRRRFQQLLRHPWQLHPRQQQQQHARGVFDPTQQVCTWFSRGNFVASNHFANNGGNGNPTNGDIANQATGLLDAAGCAKNNNGCVPAPNPDPNCFATNALGGSTSEWPLGLQEAPCPPGLSETPLLTAQLVCATGAASLFTAGTPITPPPCNIPGFNYPQHDGNCTAPGQQVVAADDPTTKFCFLPLSYTLSPAVSPPMPDPCAGVPVNAWCSAPTTVVSGASKQLPDTAAGRPGPWLPIAAAILVGAISAGGLRRRRRRRTAVT